MIQKYIAMYMQPEQWTDLRRYHYSNNRNGIGVGGNNEIVYPTLRRPYNLYAPYWIDGLSTAEQERTWIQRINYDPETEKGFAAHWHTHNDNIKIINRETLHAVGHTVLDIVYEQK